jgi:hypothetical protein
MQHASHAGHHEAHAEHAPEKGSMGRNIGLTMAMLGVFLAVCSALVAGSRTEFIASLVEQTKASLKYQTVSTKYRMLEAQLQQLHALTPDVAHFNQDRSRILGMRFSGAQQQVAQLMDLETGLLLNTVTPNHQDMLRFSAMVHRLNEQREAGQEWIESYDDAIHDNAEAAERFEWAQLCSEVGIVLCSVALLLSNKPLWYVSMGLGALCILVVLATAVSSHMAVQADEQHITKAQAAVMAFTSTKSDKAEDEEFLKSIEQAPPTFVPLGAPSRVK